MLVKSLCWRLNDGDDFKMLVTKKNMLVTFFCMWVTFQSVTNIIICQNVILVTDIWRWCLNLDVDDVTCHQHIWSPTSFTNTDVTKNIRLFKLCYDQSGWQYTNGLERANWILQVIQKAGLLLTGRSHYLRHIIWVKHMTHIWKISQSPIKVAWFSLKTRKN